MLQDGLHGLMLPRSVVLHYFAGWVLPRLGTQTQGTARHKGRQLGQKQFIARSRHFTGCVGHKGGCRTTDERIARGRTSERERIGGVVARTTGIPLGLQHGFRTVVCASVAGGCLARVWHALPGQCTPYPLRISNGQASDIAREPPPTFNHTVSVSLMHCGLPVCCV